MVKPGTGDLIKGQSFVRGSKFWLKHNHKWYQKNELKRKKMKMFCRSWNVETHLQELQTNGPNILLIHFCSGSPFLNNSGNCFSYCLNWTNFSNFISLVSNAHEHKKQTQFDHFEEKLMIFTLPKLNTICKKFTEKI